MNQPYPGPQQPPYQPPHHGQPTYPGPYGPPPPKKGMSTGAIVAIVLGSIFGGLVLLLLLGALVSTSDDDSKASPATTPTAEAPAEQATPAPAKKTKEPAKQAPVKVTAKKTTFAPSILHDGGAHTSVAVTVTNNSDEKIDINPLYFTITDTDGSKHTAELGMDKNQMDTVDLAPGENITGVITGKGDFTPKYVTYTDGIFGDGIRGNVS